MKTKILLMSLMVSFSLYAFAQETQESKTAGYKTAFKHSSAGSNWFIHVGAGGQVFFGDSNDDANPLHRISLAPTLSVGKWFSPYWGIRVKGQGGTLHSFKSDANYMRHDKYYNVHLDAMWNLANYWGVYSPKKLFNFTPYLGLGFGHRFALDESTYMNPQYLLSQDPEYRMQANVMTVNPGIQFGFRLSNRVNLDFDLGTAIVPDYFDRYVKDQNYETVTTASVGFTFKLGKTDFDVVEPMDYGLIDDLNAKINALRAENDKLSKRPVSCPECPQVAPPTVNEQINYVPNVVFFRLNSSKIDANQQISVYNTAEFMKNTGAKIKVVGYADKKTGSGKYNLALSEKRAKAVAKELTTKYNIPTQNITVEWKGADEQPYKENNWNRVVIMSGNK